MPIYAYKCSACGYAHDVLQKMSDPLLTICPQCGADKFVKQVTAAGFQLKGSGWYATDFKGGGKPAQSAGEGGDKLATPSSDAASGTSPSAESGKSDKAAPVATSAPAPAPAAAPSPASGTTPSPKAG